MTEKTPPTKPYPPYIPMSRRRPERVMLAAFILMLGIAGYQFYTEGYAVLIGSAQESGGEDGKMVRQRCTYFTGTEKFITHMFRAASDSRGKSSCAFLTKLPKPAQENPYEITIPGVRTIPFGEQKMPAPKVPATPVPEVPAAPPAAEPKP
ncbi:MAG: hypothetical protein ACYCZX_09965 [Rhodospirillaceae bacterium]